MLGLIAFFWIGGFDFFSFLARNFHRVPTIGDILINRMIAFLFVALFLEDRLQVQVSDHAV